MAYKPPRGLGKGLGALLGDDLEIDSLRKPVGYINKEIAGDAPTGDSADIMRIPVSKIEPNPFQSRRSASSSQSRCGAWTTDATR